MASTSGLGMATGVEGTARNDPLPLMDGVRESLRLDTVSCEATTLDTGKKDSAYHSYHTCRVFVSRQMDTLSSELLGKYNGSLKGKKSGNQLSISLDIHC